MPRSSQISIILVNINATVYGYAVLFQLSIILVNTIPYTPTIPSIYAALFLLRPKVAKEHLQEYILPLRFYGEVCYVCFRICCILLIIYILRTQELQLPLSQNFYLTTFSFMYIRYINFFILYMHFYIIFLKVIRNNS